MERFVQLPMELSDPLEPEEDLRQQALIDALEAYDLHIETLRSAVRMGENLSSMIREGEVPEEVALLTIALSDMLRPTPREQIRSPADAAAFLMLEMGSLDQEQFRVLCLDTKNRLQKTHLVYQGSLNAAMVRVGEVFKEPVRLNSAAIICAHNHPSGEPTPSPEDVLLTRQIVEAGNLLDIDVLDHLIIGKGRWASLRERGLGFRS
jgi:DNA repair protein RadC